MLDHLPLDLPQRIAAGDSRAEEELAEHFSRRVYALILARVHDRDLARDLTQDVLIGVLAALRASRLRDPASLTAFVLGTARNQISNYFRERSRQPPMEELPPDLRSPTVDDHLDLEERAAALRTAMRKLNEKEREVLRLTAVERLPVGEIAQRLGLAAEVVRKRKSRALQKLTGYIANLRSHRSARSY